MKRDEISELREVMPHSHSLLVQYCNQQRKVDRIANRIKAMPSVEALSKLKRRAFAKHPSIRAVFIERLNELRVDPEKQFEIVSNVIGDVNQVLGKISTSVLFGERSFKQICLLADVNPFKQLTNINNEIKLRYLTEVAKCTTPDQKIDLYLLLPKYFYNVESVLKIALEGVNAVEDLHRVGNKIWQAHNRTGNYSMAQGILHKLCDQAYQQIEESMPSRQSGDLLLAYKRLQQYPGCRELLKQKIAKILEEEMDYADTIAQFISIWNIAGEVGLSETSERAWKKAGHLVEDFESGAVLYGFAKLNKQKRLQAVQLWLRACNGDDAKIEQVWLRIDPTVDSKKFTAFGRDFSVALHFWLKTKGTDFEEIVFQQLLEQIKSVKQALEVLNHLDDVEYSEQYKKVMIRSIDILESNPHCSCADFFALSRLLKPKDRESLLRLAKACLERKRNPPQPEDFLDYQI